jgi:hypothetical protein
MKEPNQPEMRRRTRSKSPSPYNQAEYGMEKPKNSSSRAKKPSVDPVEDLTPFYLREW